MILSKHGSQFLAIFLESFDLLFLLFFLLADVELECGTFTHQNTKQFLCKHKNSRTVKTISSSQTSTRGCQTTFAFFFEFL